MDFKSNNYMLPTKDPLQLQGNTGAQSKDLGKFQTSGINSINLKPK